MIIKVCGMREAENITAVSKVLTSFDVEAWLGLIFYPHSSRYVEQAQEIPANIKRVGVFVNAASDEIMQRIADYRLDIIQLHGDESIEQIEELRKTGKVIIKALPIASASDLDITQKYEGHIDYFLFDTKVPCRHGQFAIRKRGGTGQRFDWQVLQEYSGKTPFLLSGGIGEEHSPELKLFRHPQWAGIDLNSRFEIAPAIKDSNKLHNFINSLEL